ncbi:MAG: hypothetical protein HFJ30_03050 [Clostridia bacterium]|jgi:hypothetical protein|nr:hypothetical protein [Clostridia bacterium]
MNLKKEFKKEEIELLQVAGVNVEDREYSKEELRKCEMDIEEFIMSHSSKNGDISKLSNQYYGILNTLIN